MRARARQALTRHLAIVVMLVVAAAVSTSSALSGSPQPTPSAQTLQRLARVASAVERTYGWPLRPFDRQHPIRGGFGDPRFGSARTSFHSGIDIAAPGGTPVYAVAPGEVYREPDRVAVYRHWTQGVPDEGEAYWHIAPSAHEHAWVAAGTLLGRVKPRWAHLHFAELHADLWVNPLRSTGGIRPFVDTMPPAIGSIRLVSSGAVVDPSSVGRVVDAVAAAWQPPPRPRPPAPWQYARLAPALLEWRLVHAHRIVVAWTVAVDFRLFLPPRYRFPRVYAPATTENTPGSPGNFAYFLFHRWNAATAAPGGYRLDVRAYSTGGRSVTRSLWFRVPPPIP